MAAIGSSVPNLTRRTSSSCDASEYGALCAAVGGAVGASEDTGPSPSGTASLALISTVRTSVAPGSAAAAEVGVEPVSPVFNCAQPGVQTRTHAEKTA